MPMVLFVGTMLIVGYACWLIRVHLGKVKPWLGGICFFLIGAAGSSAAFAAMNLLLSFTATDRETAGWSLLFAAIGGIAAIVCGIIAAGFAWVLWERLWVKPVIVGLTVLMLVEFLAMAACSRIPSANWW